MQFFLSEQLSIFLFSILCGIIIGVVNEPFRFIRYLGFNTRAEVFVQDIIFMAVSAFITFFFILCYNKGDIRAFILLGELCGFLLFRFTIGRLTGKLFYYIRFVIKKLSSAVKMAVKVFLTIIAKIKDFILVKIPLFNKTDKTACNRRSLYCIIIKSVGKFNRKLFKR